MGFCEEIGIIELKMRTVSGTLSEPQMRVWGTLLHILINISLLPNLMVQHSFCFSRRNDHIDSLHVRLFGVEILELL